MRISQQMLHQNSVRQMNQNLSRLEKSSNEVSTGKLLHKPSDDPIAVAKAMNLKSGIAANEQYERNTNEATLWMDETGQTVNEMVNVMQRARELAVRGSNDTLSGLDRTVIAAEVEELSEQIRQYANSKVNGNYLFNGQQTDQPPFPDEKSIQESYNGLDTNAKNFTIGDGVVVKANVSAHELFGNEDDTGGGSNLFQVLANLASGIRDNDSIPLEKVDEGIDRLLIASAQVGARMNRVEAVQSRIQDSSIQLESMLSKVEDIDYAEAVMKLKIEESVYQASLAASAKVIQPSLMDFLR